MDEAETKLNPTSGSDQPAALDYTFLADLTDLLPEIPDESIVSRTIHTGDGVKGILFGFATGQELSQHTASRPAILHFISGKGLLTLGEDDHLARPGTWVHMPAHLPHSIKAEEPTIMLLLLL